MAMPRPETPAQMPMARPRSSAGKTLVRIDRVAGMINAPPMPMIARVTISSLGDAGERREHRADAEDDEPDREGALAARTGRRGCPAVSSRPAKTSV